ELHAGCRRLLRSLDDARAAGREGAGDLARGRERGKVPGRKGGNGAHGLRLHPLPNARLARRNDAAVESARLLRIPLEDVRRGADLGARLGERLALLQREQPGYVLHALAEAARRFQEDRTAGDGWRRRPHLEAALDCRHCGGKIVRRGVRQLADRLFRGRIDDRLPAAASALRPGAVDEERERAVGEVVACVHLRSRPLFFMRQRRWSIRSCPKKGSPTNTQTGTPPWPAASCAARISWM